jgi:hypothetical protein
MEKISRRIFTGTQVTPTAHLQSAVAIATGKRKVIRLDAGGSEGRVVSLYCKQATGTGVGFSVRLLSSSTPYGNGTPAEANYNAAVSGSPEPFDILPIQTVTSGNAVDVRPVNGYPFQSDDSSSPTNRERYVYLVIIPTNTPDASTWDVAVTFTNSR